MTTAAGGAILADLSASTILATGAASAQTAAVIAALAAGAVPASQVGQPSGVASLDALSRVSVSKSYCFSTQLHAIGINNWQNTEEGFLGGGSITKFGETTRVLYTAKGPLSQLRLFLPIQISASGNEKAPANPVFYMASIEYPLNSALVNPTFTLAGQSLMQVGVLGAGTLTDPVGVSIPAGAQFAIRLGTYVVSPPASVSIAATSTGGSLAAGTHFYKLTCVRAGAESGPSTEVSITTTGTTSAITLTATAPGSAVGYDSIKVYHATTSGAELYLGSIVGPGLVYVDNGALPTVAGAVVPTTYPTYPVASVNTAGCYSSSVSNGGTGANLVQSQGTTGLVTGTYGGFSAVIPVNQPILVGDDVAAFPVIGMGDSIQSGTGVFAAASLLGSDFRTLNWFGAGLAGNNLSFLNVSLPTSTAASLMNLTNGAGQLRLRSIDFGAYVVSDLGSNDIYLGNSTWQQLALYHVQIATAVSQRGKRYYITTLPPRLTSTSDNMLTVAGQTIDATHEPIRVNYNTWVRNGMRMSAGVPVLTGGTQTPYIMGYFDMSQALGEVNSSGAPTLNGGYWPVSGVVVGTGTIAAGSSGNNVYYANWSGVSNANYALTGAVLKMTSGADAGQNAIASGSNSTSIFYCGAGITTASLEVGDTFSVYEQPGYDGVHPSLYGSALIANGTSTSGYMNFSTWAAQNLGGF